MTTHVPSRPALGHCDLFLVFVVYDSMLVCFGLLDFHQRRANHEGTYRCVSLFGGVPSVVYSQHLGFEPYRVTNQLQFRKPTHHTPTLKPYAPNPKLQAMKKFPNLVLFIALYTSRLEHHEP